MTGNAARAAPARLRDQRGRGGEPPGPRRRADRCALFTDLANPTSNRIYASIGYRPVGEWEEHAFDPPAPRA